jgi:hypothetical protein
MTPINKTSSSADLTLFASGTLKLRNGSATDKPVGSLRTIGYFDREVMRIPESSRSAL